jgi:hypothetical protein
VRVRYDPAHPSAGASVDQAGALWGGPALVGGLDLGFAAVGAGLLWGQARRRIR